VVDAGRGVPGHVHAAVGHHDRERRPAGHPAGSALEFADLQWVVDAYALTLASFLLTAGSLADIYGRRVLYRQVGTATGIALLGTLFSHDVKDEVLTRTAAVPELSARGPQIAGAVQSGQIGNLIARLPAPARQVAGTITRAAFTTGLNRILLVAAIIAFVAGVVSLATIRSRDFARAAPGGQEEKRPQ